MPAAVEAMGPAAVNEAAEADAKASHRATGDLAALLLEVGADVVAESPSEWNFVSSELPERTPARRTWAAASYIEKRKLPLQCAMMSFAPRNCL